MRLRGWMLAVLWGCGRSLAPEEPMGEIVEVPDRYVRMDVPSEAPDERPAEAPVAAPADGVVKEETLDALLATPSKDDGFGLDAAFAVGSGGEGATGLGGFGTRGAGLGGGGTGYGGGVGTSMAVGRGASGRGVEATLQTWPAGVPPLRAGEVDDNADLPAFLTFVGAWTDRVEAVGHYQPLTVADRRLIQVVDAAGVPVPDAEVRVHGAGASWGGVTGGDGRIAFHPHMVGVEHPEQVMVVVDGRVTAVPWRGAADVQVALDQRLPDDAAVPLDVVFVLDTTGSMADELDRIKRTLASVTARVRELEQRVDLRYGAVLYRDRGDAYRTQTLPFTADVPAFERSLAAVGADGGGDTPEDLNEGLRVAVEDLPWRDHAARVAFLVADAPPHMDYGQQTPYGDSALTALERGIRVHTVAASGLDPVGTLVFRQIAQVSRGRFVFIEYGSMAATAASHGVSAPVQPNNLDRILFERVREEVEGWRAVP